MFRSEGERDSRCWRRYRAPARSRNRRAASSRNGGGRAEPGCSTAAIISSSPRGTNVPPGPQKPCPDLVRALQDVGFEAEPTDLIADDDVRALGKRHLSRVAADGRDDAFEPIGFGDLRVRARQCLPLQSRRRATRRHGTPAGRESPCLRRDRRRHHRALRPRGWRDRRPRGDGDRGGSVGARRLPATRGNTRGRQPKRQGAPTSGARPAA